MDSGSWEAYQIGLEVVLSGGVVNGKTAEAYVKEFAFATGGGMTIHKCDVHATTVVCGAGVTVGLSMAGIECPKALVRIRKIN